MTIYFEEVTSSMAAVLGFNPDSIQVHSSFLYTQPGGNLNIAHSRSNSIKALSRAS
jgi:hypothetical protein